MVGLFLGITFFAFGYLLNKNLKTHTLVGWKRGVVFILLLFQLLLLLILFIQGVLPLLLYKVITGNEIPSEGVSSYFLISLFFWIIIASLQKTKGKIVFLYIIYFIISLFVFRPNLLDVGVYLANVFWVISDIVVIWNTTSTHVPSIQTGSTTPQSSVHPE